VAEGAAAATARRGEGGERGEEGVGVVLFARLATIGAGDPRARDAVDGAAIEGVCRACIGIGATRGLERVGARRLRVEGFCS
jgi:hypothetical protein